MKLHNFITFISHSSIIFISHSTTKSQLQLVGSGDSLGSDLLTYQTDNIDSKYNK